LVVLEWALVLEWASELELVSELVWPTVLEWPTVSGLAAGTECILARCSDPGSA
jgi:hypothetical protein